MAERPVTEELAGRPEGVRTRPAAHPLDSRKVFVAAVLGALLLFPLLQVASGGLNYHLHMMVVTFMWMAMASSWNIIGGYTGYVSLGHNVFFGVGGYVTGTLIVYFRISPFLSAPLAGLVALGLGLLVGLITLRTRGPAFIISTIALLLLFRLGFDNWEVVGGANGISLPLPPLPADRLKIPFYYGMLLTAAAAIYMSYRIRHSKFGLGLRAIAEDEVKAEVAGIPTTFYKIVAFAISGFFIGVAGALWGYYLTYLRPSIFFEIALAAEMVLMTILGGRGTVAGPVLGAVLLIAINEFVVAKFGATELNLVATGALMLIILLFFPEGIVGTLKERRKLPGILDWG